MMIFIMTIYLRRGAARNVLNKRILYIHFEYYKRNAFLTPEAPQKHMLLAT